MAIDHFLKPVFFIYESVRIIILTITLMFVLPGTSAIPWLAFASPGALFSLMALFIWIDISRYHVYIPLYIAGKCIGIFILVGFSIISRRFTIIDGNSGTFLIAELIFLCGDLLALAGIFYVYSNMRKPQDEPVLIDVTDTEGKQ